MRVLTATEFKNKLGEALSFSGDDSVLIKKNGKEAYMVFTAAAGRKLVLASYAQGNLSRDHAMKLLGLEWYGQLLDAMAENGIERPSIPKPERKAMVAAAVETLGRK